MSNAIGSDPRDPITVAALVAKHHRVEHGTEGEELGEIYRSASEIAKDELPKHSEESYTLADAVKWCDPANRPAQQTTSITARNLDDFTDKYCKESFSAMGLAEKSQFIKTIGEILLNTVRLKKGTMESILDRVKK